MGNNKLKRIFFTAMSKYYTPYVKSIILTQEYFILTFTKKEGNIYLNNSQKILAHARVRALIGSRYFLQAILGTTARDTFFI